MKTVLLVDDDTGLLGPVRMYLARRGRDLRILTAGSGEEAIRILDNEPVDLVLSDLRMPKGDGIDILAHLSSCHPGIPVVVMSGYVLEEDVAALARYGHLKCLRKPVGPAQVFDAVAASLEHQATSAALDTFSLAGILHLVEIEEKTCLLVVTLPSGKHGSFLFVRGRVQRTVCGPLRGDDAGLEMLTWEQPAVQVKPLGHMEDARLGPAHNVTEMIKQALEGTNPEPGPELAPSNPPADEPEDATREPGPDVTPSLLLAGTLITFFTAVHLSGGMPGFFGNALEHPAVVFLHRALVVWTMTTLWIAYRRWLAPS